MKPFLDRGRHVFRAGLEGIRGGLPYWGSFTLVVLSAVWPFRSVLSYYFTKPDTFQFIHSSRLRSPADLVRILTHPVKSLLHENEVWYRPVNSLSYSLDYALWGLEPFGYHLTDLILHAAVAGLLFCFVYRVHRGDLATAVLAGGLYTFHPLLFDVVPIMAYRHVLLPTVFLLGGMVAFWHHEYGGGGTGARVLSLVCFLLAAGSKETGLLFLPLVALLLVLFGGREGEGWLRRGRRKLRRLAPYVGLALLYVGWWGYVTGWRVFVGGGNTLHRTMLRGSVLQTLRFIVYGGLIRNTPFYFSAVLTPFEPLAVPLQEGVNGILAVPAWYFSGVTSAWIPALPLSFAAALVLWRTGRRAFAPGSSGSPRRMASGAGRLLLGFGLLWLLAFPLCARAVRAVVLHAYEGTTLPWLTAAMESRQKFPVSRYQDRALGYLLTGGVFLCLLGAGVVALLDPDPRRRYSEALRRLTRELRRPRYRPGWFHLGWFLLPGLFFGLTRIAGYDNVYPGVPPLSALTATLLVGSVRGWVRAGKRVFGRTGTEAGMLPAGRALGHGTLAVAAGLLVGLLFLGSPWVNREFERVYGPVQMSHKRYFRALKPALRKLPPGSEVRLLKVPTWFHPDYVRSELPYSGKAAMTWVPHALLVDMMTESDLTLVERTGRGYLAVDPDPKIHLEVREEAAGRYVLEARVSGFSGEPFVTSKREYGTGSGP